MGDNLCFFYSKPDHLIYSLENVILDDEKAKKIDSLTLDCTPCEGAIHLLNQIIGLNHLRYLYLRGVEMNNFYLSELIDGLKDNISLEVLDLRFNEISDRGVIKLLKAIEYHPAINSIYLSKNNISDLGANAFAYFITINPNISILDLSENKISFEGTNNIIKSIRLNTSIHTLLLHGNESISSKEFTSFVEDIYFNLTLTKLTLPNNKKLPIYGNILRRNRLSKAQVGTGIKKIDLNEENSEELDVLYAKLNGHIQIIKDSLYLDLDYIQQNVDLYVSQKIDLSSSKILVEKKSMENRLEKTQSFIQKLERIIQHYSEENLSLYDVLRKKKMKIQLTN